MLRAKNRNLLKSADFLISVAFLASLFYLVHYFDWGAGTKRGLVLLILLGLSYLASKYLSSNGEVGVNKKLVFLLIGVFLIFNTFYLIKNINSMPIDIGTTTINAVNVLWKSGLNPYASPVDPLPESSLYPDFFLEGYKYFPATLIIYSPLVLIFGTKGIYLTNFIFYLLSLFLILKIGRVIYKDLVIPYVAIILFLSFYLVTSQLFKYGVNDILPIFFILVSYYFFLKEKEKWSGLFLGLSIATVWLPGTLFLIILMPAIKNRVRFLSITLGVVALFLIPFLLWNYQSFIDSDFIILLCRGEDSTSFLYGLPKIISAVIKGFIFLAFLFFLKKIFESPICQDKKGIVFRYIIALVLMSLIIKWGHRNYQIWAAPFFAIQLASFRLEVFKLLKELVRIK